MSSTKAMPQYQCHKKVWALQIGEIKPLAEGGAIFTPTDKRYAAISLPQDFIDRHNPQTGGYYVVYENGYSSFSPQEPFEKGYTLIEPTAEVPQSSVKS